MRITVATRALSPNGGIERYTTEAVKALVRLGHEVSVITSHLDPGPVAGTTTTVVRPLPLPTAVQVYAELATFGLRATRTARRGPDDSLLYRPLGHAYGPGVITAHSCHAAWLADRDRVEGPRRRNVLDRALLAQERRTFADDRCSTTTVSHRCAAEIEHHYGVPRSTIRIVPPAIDGAAFAVRTDEERERARLALGLAPDTYVVGTVANYSFTRKRVATSVEACARLGACLVVAGTPGRDGDEVVERAARLGVDCRFLGGDVDAAPFYAGLDAFVLPSMNEAYGMAAHEAMARGVPVVVSDRCGIVDFLTAGVEATVVPDDPCSTPDGLAAAIDSVRSSGGATADAGAAWAHEHTWDGLGEALEQALLAHRAS